MKFNKQYILVFAVALLAIFLFIRSQFSANIVPYSLSPDFSKGAEYMRVKHLGTLNIHSLKMNGILVGRLSGLAWEEDSESLYAISDNSYLFRFSIETSNGFLSDIKPLSVVPLLNKQGKPLVNTIDQDAEGLAIVNANNGLNNDSVLLVSFEQNTRVAAYSVTGKWLHDLPLPNKLQRKENYYRRNSSLESILVHPQYGVIVATELFMEKESQQRRVLYSISPEFKDIRWQFLSLPYQYSAVTGMDVALDGSIILIERSWPSPFSSIVIGLRRIKLTECEQHLPCPVEDLAIFDSNKGWAVDNYEGLSHYKGNQFFMVSDNNSGVLQNTLLTLIEIKN